MKQNGTEIIKPRSRIGVPFVTVTFLLMLVYLLIRSADLFSGNSISAYNIGAPTVDTLDKNFTGLILRDEITVNSRSAGTVNYYRSSGERLSGDSLVCVIDKGDTLQDKLSDINALSEVLSTSSILKIREHVKDIQDSYDPRDFGTAVSSEAALRGFIYTRILEEAGTRIKGLDKLVNVRTSETGFLMLKRDGYENKEPEDLELSDFSSEPYGEERMSGEQVEKGDFLYKLATDNRFRIVFPLTDEEAAGLFGRKNLAVTMADGNVITGAFSVTALSDGTKAGVLTFQKYGLNYLDRRLQVFRIADEAVKGFKIPESSIVTKSFFVVPSEFITENVQGNSKVVLLETAEGTRFVPVTAYSSGSGDAGDLIIGENVTYILGDGLSAGSVILYEEQDPVTGKITTKRETLGVMASLEGVYQINKGYCVFKPVLRLDVSVDASYIMVSSEIGYSLRSYDRIVLQASDVKENEIIYE